MESVSVDRVTRALAALALAWLFAAPAGALDFWDGRIQVHGFYEARLSYSWQDFRTDNAIDVQGFQHILDVEIEADLAPDGWGPFDLVSTFARIEVKYDCVYARGCYLIPDTNAWGPRSQRVPKRIQNGRRDGAYGSQLTFDTRSYTMDDPRLMGTQYAPDSGDFSRRAVPIIFGNTFETLFGASLGPDGVAGTSDDAGSIVFSQTLKYGGNGPCVGTTVKNRADTTPRYLTSDLPWMFTCKDMANGYFRNVPNPFNVNDSYAGVGLFPGQARGTRPYRPSTEWAVGALPVRGQSQGLFNPSPYARQFLQDKEGERDQFFTVEELQWNRGASQQDEKELREAYADIEMFDSRLWLRLGKQTIVWGKTELFRNQDQWNAVDIALGPLVSLEESRIAQWAARGVWSFYEVGPLSDVRLELAAIFDEFEPNDLGICGEPLVPRAACAKSFGIIGHGATGIGVLGEVRPKDPWQSWKGLEAGARLEFRWDRFSVALTEFYGFTDQPYQDIAFGYDRNVDPVSGRPRIAGSRGSCQLGTEVACLTPQNVQQQNPINRQLFDLVCASTVGVAATTIPAASSACAFTLFESQAQAVPGLRLSVLLSAILSGRGSGATNGADVLGQFGGFNANTVAALAAFPNAQLWPSAGPGARTPLVALNSNPATDGTPFTELAKVNGAPPVGAEGAFFLTGLGVSLTEQQEALLGCGSFYQTQCDIDGIDLGNAEASALVQSFPMFEGTAYNPYWNTTDASVAQPGTVGFVGGTPCLRYENGQTYILPGCDPNTGDGVSGPPSGSAALGVHPFTGQPWASEMAIVSWNFLMLTTVFSNQVGTTDPAVFDPDRPFATGRCSFATPQFCTFAAGIIYETAVTRTDVRAGGNGRFGRRDFIWAAGGEAVLRYEKRNVLGFSTDFAEDVTKSSIGVEFTWQAGLPYTDGSQYDGISKVDTYNLTLSVDRPSFINFLNANRTFFINSQLFISYIDGYNRFMTADGPWTFLWLITANTGYFQDRLLPNMTLVYDFRSNSGAFLPSVQYRFTENFSATVGAAILAGREAPKIMGVDRLSSRNADRVGDRIFVENGISPVRDMDSFFVRLRYTF